MIPPKAASALQQFNESAEQCINAFFKTLEVPGPSILYHYTNDTGLRGILESGKLWLTDMFNLNDPSELRHGLSHVVRILNAKAEKGPDESKVFAQLFEETLTRGAYQKFAHHFVLSFSAVGDDLGQWRAYADNGRGYALGFEAKEIANAYKCPKGAPIQNNGTHPITYDNKKCEEVQKQIIDKMFDLISLPKTLGLDADSRDEFMNHLYANLAQHTFRVAVVFKHEAYKNEQEWRFMEIHPPNEPPPPEVKFRSRPYSLVRYREFDWRNVAQGALKRIVIGPAAVADRTRAHQFVTDCLSAFHRGDVTLFRSAIPYRAM